MEAVEHDVRRRRRTAYGILLPAVLATVSWRKGALYAGGVDPVVAAKGLLSVIALALAWRARQECLVPRAIRSRTFWLLLCYVTIATFGAWTTGDLLPSAVLAVRVVILAMMAVLVARTFSIGELLPAWFAALATVGLGAALSGLPTVASGRLGGGIPPLDPNEVAMLCGLPCLGLVWLALHGRARPRHVVLLVVLLGIVWLTSSRTALMAVMVGIVVMAVQARRLSRGMLVTAVGAVAGLIFVMFGTDVMSSFFLRGGDQNITTLSSRTIAWDAAFDYSSSDWVRWMGAGLAKKEIPVAGQYWATQVLDSSWISALVHAGRAGALLLLGWMAWALMSTFTDARPQRMILSGVIVYVILRSILESGLIDSSPIYITFMLVSLLAGTSSRRTHRLRPVGATSDRRPSLRGLAGAGRTTSTRSS